MPSHTQRIKHAEHDAVLRTQVPGLAVVLVGSRKDSETYVRSKKKACAEVGIADFGVDLPEDVTEQQVLEVRPLRQKQALCTQLCKARSASLKLS